MPDQDPSPQAITDRLDALEAELRSLRSQVAAPPRPTDPADRDLGPGDEPIVTARAPQPPSPSRRLVLGGAVAGAAAAIAGVVTGAEPAAAATGTMTFGTTMEAGSSATTLSGSLPNNQSVMIVRNADAGSGLQGIALAGRGVSGDASTGIGVRGTSQSGIGVRGESQSGTAVNALAFTGTGVTSFSNRIHLALGVSAPRPAPTADTFVHAAGDVVRDDQADLWLCTAQGTPGTWRKLAGPKTAGALHVLPAPVRVYDSRAFTQPAVGLKTQFSGGETRTIDCTVNTSGVPTDATAVIVTCLIVNAVAGNGNFTIWADGQAKPNANTLVWGGTDGRASTLALSALGPNAKVKVTPSIKADVVIDVVGYHR